MEPEIGQIWKRKDGRRYLIEDRANQELKLKPLDKGRTSWKWDRSVKFEMEYCGEANE